MNISLWTSEEHAACTKAVCNDAFNVSGCCAGVYVGGGGREKVRVRVRACSSILHLCCSRQCSDIIKYIVNGSNTQLYSVLQFVSGKCMTMNSVLNISLYIPHRMWHISLRDIYANEREHRSCVHINNAKRKQTQSKHTTVCAIIVINIIIRYTSSRCILHQVNGVSSIAIIEVNMACVQHVDIRMHSGERFHFQWQSEWTLTDHFYPIYFSLSFISSQHSLTHTNTLESLFSTLVCVACEWIHHMHTIILYCVCTTYIHDK